MMTDRMNLRSEVPPSSDFGTVRYIVLEQEEGFDKTVAKVLHRIDQSVEDSVAIAELLAMAPEFKRRAERAEKLLKEALDFLNDTPNRPLSSEPKRKSYALAGRITSYLSEIAGA
jgi:hypothetical protein